MQTLGSDFYSVTYHSYDADHIWNKSSIFSTSTALMDKGQDSINPLGVIVL